MEDYEPSFYKVQLPRCRCGRPGDYRIDATGNRTVEKAVCWHCVESRLHSLRGDADYKLNFSPHK